MKSRDWIENMPYQDRNFAALCIDSSIVVFFRLTKIMSGKDTHGREASLMVAEKAAAFVEVMDLLRREIGSHPAQVSRKVIKLYAGKVAANRKRLSGHGA